MSNRELWRYYLETRDHIDLGSTPAPTPGSPPYDNLNVVEAPPYMPLQQTQELHDQTLHIPGPGSRVQLGLFRKRSHDAMVARGECSQTRPTLEFIQEAYNAPPLVDFEFTTPRWTSTVEYIRREGVDDDFCSCMNRTRPFWTLLADIQCPVNQFTKVNKIVAIISTLTSNDQGDFLVTLKDPSGTIDGSMHHNIFLNHEYRIATSVGAVVFARNVTVGRFISVSKYLNITARNIIKIIGVNAAVAEYEDNTGNEYETVPDSDGDD